jgi:LysR family transcriptional regulator, cyn operon transcriptional activator
MNFRQLKTFVTIAESGGFARAEGQLYVTQSAASRQILGLEAELGIPLFDRIGRRIKLTSEGEDLLKRGRRVLHGVESFVERARRPEERRGRHIAGRRQHAAYRKSVC